MDQVVQQISIQFPTIPEILALANSTFALLLTLGIFFRIFSQQEIFSDFFQIFIQNLYQDTYLQILKERNLIQQDQSTNAQENTNQAEQNLQEKEISDKIQLPEFTSKFRDYLEQSSQVQESPLKLYNQMDEVLESQKDSTSCGFNLTSIEQTNENINTLQDKSTIFNKNKIISSSENQKQQKSSQSNNRLFQSKTLTQIEIQSYSRHKSFQKSKKSSFVTQISILSVKNIAATTKDVNFFEKKQINKQLNILDFYKDLIFIKKSIMILLSKEQLAAIQLVGYSSLYMTDQPSKSNNKNLSDQKYQNYLEEQQNILNSCDLKCKYINKFLKNSSCANNNNDDDDNKLLEYKSKSKSQVQQINDDGQFAGQDFLEKDTSDNIYMPQFASKFRYYLEQSPQYQQNNFEFKIEQDQIIETKELNNESQIQNKSIETQLYKKAQQKNQYTLNNTQISRSNDSKLNENINVSQSNQIILKSNSIKQNQIRQDKNLESISQKLRAIKDLNIFQKVKGAIFEKRWFCKKKKKESLDEKKQGFETFKVLIEQQINKQINIFDFYKDLLFIKKSVMILLSKEQLAAMQLVGNLIQSEQPTNAQENANQAEQNLQEKDASDNISLPQFSSKFRDYLEQSSQAQEKHQKFYNQKDEVIESQTNSTNCGFYLNSIEQSNQKANIFSNKPTFKLQNNNKINSPENKKLQKLNLSKSSLLLSKNINQSAQVEADNINLKSQQFCQTIKLRSFEYFESRFRAIQDTNLFNKAKRAIFQNRSVLFWQKLQDLWKKMKDDKKQTVQINLPLNLIKQQINNKEQLAAMQLVGYSSLFITDQFRQKDNNNLDNHKQKNYLEEQQTILNSFDKKCKYFKKFLKNVSSANYDKNDINSRILSSVSYKNN
ncbi:hypothetical protein ABPG73_011037 [Tetrahymena malaccensis]